MCSGHLDLANSWTIFALIKYPMSFLFYHQNVLGFSGKGCKWNAGVAEQSTGLTPPSLHSRPQPTFSNLSRGCYAFKPWCCLGCLRQDRKTGGIKGKGKKPRPPESSWRLKLGDLWIEFYSCLGCKPVSENLHMVSLIGEGEERKEKTNRECRNSGKMGDREKRKKWKFLWKAPNSVTSEATKMVRTAIAKALKSVLSLSVCLRALNLQCR